MGDKCERNCCWIINDIWRIFFMFKIKERDLFVINKMKNNCYDVVVNKRLMLLKILDIV